MTGKVLIIAENLPVPFDSRVWKEALALAGAGYQTTVLCPCGKGFEKTYEFLRGVHIYRHPMPAEGHSAAGYVWEYSCALFWEFLFALWIYFRRGFHVIQGCNPPDTIFLIALPFKLFGVKYIFDHHDLNPELYLSKYGKVGLLFKAQLLLERLTFRAADVAMSTNASYREVAIRRGRMSPDDVFIVRNGPDLDTFRAREPDPSLKHGKSHLLAYVGNMDDQDGLDILLDVIAHIRNSGYRDVHLTCIGGGPALPSLRQLVLAKMLTDMVDFTGRIPDEQLLRILSTADVCVNPDRPCQMNNLSTMIKIMEYMALGKPIVQFDLKEGRFSAQEASLYADTNNQVADFADKILWLLQNPDAREEMGAFGRKRVGEDLAWQYSVDNLLAAYQRAFRRRVWRFPIPRRSNRLNGKGEEGAACRRGPADHGI